ncbi:MAG: YicC/YloC family endoribonuclease [Lutispora sp.]|jgi:uncharacterized protein (TIGR00255 family)|uniref:YicC/YloC family endoribonuclease n=1 Tax=Lutispora sp. TaxID=2828727 RepID=UPI003563D5B5
MMANSMTGFGRGEYAEDNYSFIVDVRSVNHRYSDFSVRLPKSLLGLEDKVREYASSQIGRGKVDIFVNYDSFGQDVDIKIDTNLTKSYINCLKVIKDEFGINDDISLSLLTRFSDIFKVEKVEKEEDEIWNILKIALEKAFEELHNMKEREGYRLSEDIKMKLYDIRNIIDEIDDKADSVVEEYMAKLRERISELTQGVAVDESRLITEIAIMADKSSIDEEIVRLRSHVAEFEKTLDSQSSIGRKLDFIVQEMNREVNTIGSKATDIDIINNVVNLKTQIEKIREQIQNIE